MRNRLLVYEFENSRRGRVATSVSGLDQTGVAAISGLEPRADVIEEMLDQVFTIQKTLAGQDLLLFKVGLASELLHRLWAAAAVPDKDATGSAACIQSVFSGKRDQFFNDPLKFLRAAKRGVHIAVANELSLQVRQKRLALIAW